MHIPKEIWFKLPIKLRRRWWDETDLNKREPSAELLRAVQDAAAAAFMEIPQPDLGNEPDHAKD